MGKAALWRPSKRKDLLALVCVCGLVKQLTYQGFNIEAKVTALEVRVCSIPVKHNLGDAFVYQLVVMRPAGRRE